MTSSATRRKRLRAATVARQHREQAERDNTGGVLFDEETGNAVDPVYRWTWTRLVGRTGFRGRLRWEAESDPFFALLALSSVRRFLDGVELQLVDELRDADYAWDDVGFCLGVTGEAARKRFARKAGA